MRRLAWIALAAGLFASLAPAQAEETFTVKFKEVAPGQTLMVERAQVLEVWGKVEDTEGTNWKNIDMKMSQKHVYWQMILERDKNKQATRLKRGYGEARMTVDGKTEALPFEGKTVSIEKARTSAAFRFHLDGGRELLGKDALLLDREFNHHREDRTDYARRLTPGKGVKLNESWNFDATDLVKEIEKDAGAEVLASKVTAIGRLLKVYDKDGRQYGALVFHVEMPVKSLRKGTEKIPLTEGAKLVFQTTLDGCIDGSVHDLALKVVAQLNATAPITAKNGKAFKVPIVVRINEQDSIKERVGK